ncbi:MAG TPA: GNAT family acetyltransferase [Nocardioides sp.]|jgi:ribosomal protein S18 acetylase RimI-like enzyme|nr:GNAT family acetyltransferase [uncultured Nocardioides sp.]HEX5985189.1 GNAT family acetyltransferase [Nocardioides sp.]
MPVTIRPGTPDDADALMELWEAAGLKFRAHEVAAELASVTARDPEVVLVAEDESGLVGSVFGAFDGRRGWVNRLATRPDRRGEGVARALMDRLEDALRAKGCTKVNLLVRRSNDEVLEFYARRGYVADDVVFIGKRLTDD